MKKRHQLLIAFGVGHILLVACGAAGLLQGPIDNPVEDATRAYAKLSGADNGYGFFAPEVGAQFRTVFIMKDDAGRPWKQDLKLGRSSEANLRFTGISSQIIDMPPGPRHRLLQSFAAMMFGRNPEARTVTVRLEIWGFDRTTEIADYPTMAEYRSGVRPQWLPVLDATFSRADVEPSAKTNAKPKKTASRSNGENAGI